MNKSFLDQSTKKLRHLWDCRLCNNNPESDTLETREKIMIAAFEEIYEHGYQAASLSNILKNTGATKGALYHHFKNKKELGYAVIDELICTHHIDIWITPLVDVDDPIPVLRDLLLNYAATTTPEDIRRGCPLNNLSQEMSPIDNDFRERISQMYSDWQSAMEKALERGKLTGNVKPKVDSKALSLLFVATIEGCIGMAKTTQSKDTLTCCGQALLTQIETLRPNT